MESSNWVPDAVRKTVFFALSVDARGREFSAALTM